MVITHQIYHPCLGILQFLLITALLVSGCRHLPMGASDSSNDPLEAIRALLKLQAAAWNRGDIDGFMEFYARTDALRFASGGSVQRGWEATRDRYRKKYPTREAMGQLEFDHLEIQLLSREFAEVFGSFRLRRSGVLPDVSGWFTLLAQKRPEGWRVLHDHTSAAN